MEDKQKICDALCEAIQMTRAGSALTRLEYDADAEAVWAWIGDERYHRPINVACDSGLAVIVDVVRQFVMEVLL